MVPRKMPDRDHPDRPDRPDRPDLDRPDRPGRPMNQNETRSKIMLLLVLITCVMVMSSPPVIQNMCGGGYAQGFADHYNLMEQFESMYREKFPDSLSFDTLQHHILTTLMLQTREIAVKDMTKTEPSDRNTDFFLDKMQQLREIFAYLKDKRLFIEAVEDHIRWVIARVEFGGMFPEIGSQQERDDYYKKSQIASELQYVVAYVEDATREFPALQALVDRLVDLQAAVLSDDDAIVPSSKRYNTDRLVALDSKIGGARHRGGHRAEKKITRDVIKYAERQLKKVDRRVRQEQSRFIGLKGKNQSKKLHYLPALGKFVHGVRKELHLIGKKFHTTADQARFARAKRSVMAPDETTSYSYFPVNGSLPETTYDNNMGQQPHKIVKPTDFKKSKFIPLYNQFDQYVIDFSTVETSYSGDIGMEEFKQTSRNISEKYANVRFYTVPFEDKCCLDVAMEYYPNDNHKMKTTHRYSLCYDEGRISLREMLVVIIALSLAIFFSAVYCWSYAYVFKFVSNMSDRPPARSPPCPSHCSGCRAGLVPVLETENHLLSDDVNKDGDEPEESCSPRDSTAVDLG